jgi:tetratricopeptide (TPR) repeat protein
MYNAMSLMEKNQPKGAISLFNKILKQDSKNTSALFNKGLALNQIKKYSDAITCFDILLEINPKDSQAFNNKGIAMAENGNIHNLGTEKAKCIILQGNNFG